MEGRTECLNDSLSEENIKILESNEFKWFILEQLTHAYANEM